MKTISAAVPKLTTLCKRNMGKILNTHCHITFMHVGNECSMKRKFCQRNMYRKEEL